ncbi:cytochrome P450 2J2-like isoform X2 [Saccopteryx leptura]|uniref:cytochrome P450 2J2-like isoform X2 n=1 Tax=Saccopteryx leptura TaxID=249018 RepID=UPI00339CDF60
MLRAMGSLVATFWREIHPRTLLLGAIVFLLLANFFRRRLPKNFPPGPLRLPFIGSFFYFGFKQPHLTIQKYVKKYGNIFGMEFGIWPAVLISGLPLIKEALVHQDQNFVDRPTLPVRERIFKKNGLVMSNGQIWKEQRRFALTTLRNFGLGKKSLEERIQEEAYHLSLAIEEENGQPFDPHFKINNAVSNIICSITFGERFEYEDDQFQEMLRLLDELIHLEMSVCAQLYNFFPWIMKFIPGPHQALFFKWEKLKLFISHVIENHKRNWNPAEPRDFIDAYLNEIQKHRKLKHIEVIIRTMLLPVSMRKTSSSVPWIFSLLELRQLRRPCAGVCFTWPSTQKSKGTLVMTNLTALHRDPAEWATPDTFNPEHFLENGQFKKREGFLPFSVGKRACLGEQLAKSELFIFFTSLLQKFTFKPPDNEELSLEFRLGLTISPVSHRLCAVPRA